MHWDLDIIGQFAGDIAGAVIAEQTWLVMHMGLIAPRSRERHVQRVGNVLRPHRTAQLPGDDVTRVIVEHGRQIHPTPTDGLELVLLTYYLLKIVLIFCLVMALEVNKVYIYQRGATKRSFQLD
jgi:hypothetical protein